MTTPTDAPPTPATPTIKIGGHLWAVEEVSVLNVFTDSTQDPTIQRAVFRLVCERELES